MSPPWVVWHVRQMISPFGPVTPPEARNEGDTVALSGLTEIGWVPNDGLTLEEVLDDHIKPLGIPAWYGSMIGHIEKKFTMPLGIEAEIDADKGRITLLEPAVL